MVSQTNSVLAKSHGNLIFAVDRQPAAHANTT
jgi:hypothetical protein